MASEVFENAEDFGESAEIGAVNETVSRSSSESRERLVKEYGGNSASEEAVALALEWIVKHQLPDGGWSFDHRVGDGNFRDSPNPGILNEGVARVYARNGATAMALLPLLGQGHTHLAGKYKKEVRRGIEYLSRKKAEVFRTMNLAENFTLMACALSFLPKRSQCLRTHCWRPTLKAPFGTLNKLKTRTVVDGSITP